MNKVKREKSILGRIDNMSYKLVFILVLPIILSIVFMLVYAAKYHSSIVRMETINSLKTVVTEDIPGCAWDIVSGRENINQSDIYIKIGEVNETIDEITERTGAENRLSLVVASRTMTSVSDGNESTSYP